MIKNLYIFSNRCYDRILALVVEEVSVQRNIKNLFAENTYRKDSLQKQIRLFHVLDENFLFD